MMELTSLRLVQPALGTPPTSSAIQSEPTNLPPVTVTAPSQVSGTFSTAYAAFFTSAPSGPPLSDHDQPIGPDDPVVLDARSLIESHPEFLKLPEQIRELILKSDLASSQMANFLSGNGTIELTNEVGMFQGRYNQEQNKIILSADTMSLLESGGDDRVGAMLFAVAHELGEFVTASSGSNQFDMASGEAGWTQHRANGEGLANANAMLIANEIRGVDPSVSIPFTGYATNDQLVPLWNQFAADGNFDALVLQMAGLTLQYSWDGPDLNGDGVSTREDQFIYEWRNRPGAGGQ